MVISRSLVTASPINVISGEWGLTSTVYSIHLSFHADLALNGLIISLALAFTFSKAKDSISDFLVDGSNILLSTEEVSLCKKTENVFFGHCMTSENGSSLFPISATLSQAFKAAKWHKVKVSPPYITLTQQNNLHQVAIISNISTPGSILSCYLLHLFSLHHEKHWKCDPGSNTAFAISFQSWGIILFLFF